VLERDIEQQFVRYAESMGFKAKKLRIDGENGWPDRTIFTPVGVLFIEFKKPGGRLSRKQRKWINALRRLGFVAEVATSFEQARKVLNDFLEDRSWDN
jgi:hypothetical protein